MNILMETEMEILNNIWHSNHLNKLPLLRIGVLADGSCFIHCILRILLDNDYIKMNTMEKTELVKSVRNELANMITKEIFSELGNGTIAELYNIKDFYNHIKNVNNWIGDESIEFLSNMFDLNVYIMDEKTRKVYKMGMDWGRLYKDTRNSVILLYIKGHYEVIGMLKGEEIKIKYGEKEEIIGIIKIEMK